MRLLTEIQYDFKDVLIIPKISTLTSRKDVLLNREFTFLNSKNKWKSVPIIVSNMDTVGTINMANELNKYNVSVALHKHYSVDMLIKFFKIQNNSKLNFYSMGILDKDMEKFRIVYKDTYIKNVNLDVPNAYITKYIEFLKKFRDEFPTLNIMAGNVVTGEMTEQLLLAGADIVKIGIGSGSSCITRIVAGVGFPQFSAIIEAADAAHGLGGLICSDGGLINIGDFGKAFGAGADFLMSGGMFAGHEECDGEFLYDEDNNKTHMKFYGMSSAEAMIKHSGGVSDYRASEGKEVIVQYKGYVENTIKEILGGIRSTCTYVGAKSLKELSKRTTFIVVNRTHNTVFGD